jgi:hypothetical protein
MGDALTPAQDALDRMERAYRRGTGCHLTADMIESLGVTLIGEIWSAERPEEPKEHDRAR